MRILVTGGTGWIGRPLVRSLVRRDDGVRVLVPPDERARVPPEAEVVRGDLGSPDALRDSMDGIELVYHAAGVLPASGPPALERINVDGTRAVAEAAAAADVRRLVFVGSTAAYAPRGPARWPIRESDPLLDPRGPMTYGRSKALAERIVRSRLSAAGIEWVILRAPTVYGRGAPFLEALVQTLLRQPPSLLPAAIRRWPMQWVHIDDLTRSLLRVGEVSGLRAETFNIAGPELFGARTLSAIIRGLAQGRPEPPARAAPRSVLRFDLTRAERRLGYRPEVSLAEGFPDAVEHLVGPASIAGMRRRSRRPSRSGYGGSVVHTGRPSGR